MTWLVVCYLLLTVDQTPPQWVEFSRVPYSAHWQALDAVKMADPIMRCQVVARSTWR